VTSAAPSPDPSFAYLLRADHFEPGATLTPARFVDGDLQVEAEIGFVLGADVLGPEVDMATVRAAVKEVVGAIELIDVRVKLPADAAAPGMNYMIADALSNGGVILGETRVSADALDLAKEMARAEVNGEIVSSGAGKQIFGTSPWDALLWLANELPKHGRMLRAGEVVITGSLIDNPTIRAGDRAEVVFEHLGRIEVSLAGQE
jgi:2-keto-4-pentenoate hydratase